MSGEDNKSIEPSSGSLMGSGSTKVVMPAYQLAANENPGAVIAQVQFNGDNFDEWAQAIRSALRVKKKFGFVEGSVIRRTLATKENPYELWKEIKDRFSEGNGPRIQEIKAQLAQLRQGNLSVIDYFGKLHMLWEDLTNYEPSPRCTCGSCTCNLNGEIEKKREDDHIHHFLLGLDDAMYRAVRASIISSDPLPNMNQVYPKVKSVERIETVTRARESQSSQVAFATQTRTTGSLGVEDKKKLVCTSCKRNGHTAETCFELIGFPTWWGERPRPAGRGGEAGRGVGRGRGGMVRAKVAMVNAPDETSGDTGSRLNEHKYVLPCSVGLPNGTQSLSREKGTVVFDEEFKLKNVFVPGLKCNLISVSQLIEDLDMVMHIANKGFVIQDRTTRSLSGVGELRDGLYFIRRLTRFNAFRLNKDEAEDVWH
ncbi:unnamed protein product [Microthlaspi erraticum]|uniref:Retrotransposon Copia-like N-terminal domain-containing protein n=1 Tax=Microthlaspi erraticum TaxID=1685480 RepID=A0A6D2JC30_9BRAS|nr:unnamed protein product [Microthlaspi erraticum]